MEIEKTSFVMNEVFLFYKPIATAPGSDKMQARMLAAPVYFRVAEVR